MQAKATVAAIVLAGNRRHGDLLADHLGIEHKCLASVGGEPMLARVLKALRAVPSIGIIIVVVNETPPFTSVAKAFDDVRLLEGTTSPCLSVIKALEQLDRHWPVLVTTGDHALLTPDMIVEFVSNTSGDLSVAFASSERIEAAAPTTQRTYLRFADGEFSGANLFMLLNASAGKALAFWQRIERERKRPWRLIKAFGWRPLILYLLRRLTLDDAMTEASKLLGINVQSHVMSDGRAAIDVDKPADLVLVQRLLADDVAKTRQRFS